MKIKDVFAREILDSRDWPTIEAQVTLENGIKALGQVPSGVSTGANEAIELRDGDSSRHQGKGVLKAIENVKTVIKKSLVGQNAYDQEKVDRLMIEFDGTENKSKLGANAILGVSMAVCRAAARSQKMPLYKYFGQLSRNSDFSLPQPQILVLEGGRHGDWATDIQEYMVIPKKEKFESFKERLKAGTEIFQALEKILKDKNYSIGLGCEGGFCPKEIKSNEEAFELIIEAVGKAGYSLADQVVLAIDAAASEFYQDDSYIFKSEGDQKLDSKEWTEKIIEWNGQYPIWSLEDVYDEEDWDQWQYLTSQIGEKLQVIGDDLLTTNVKRIKKAIEKKACNAVIIKINQVGTITETLEAIKVAEQAGFATVISHRAGETNDDMIADLVVGTSSWQCKFGGPTKRERAAKYSRLLRIEEELNKDEKDY